MSETGSESKQKTIVIGLVVVIVLLAAIVGVLIWQGAQSNKTATTAKTTTTATNTAATSASTQMQSALANAASFDKKTATCLDGKTTPNDWVKAYYDACDSKDWKTAWEHLPAAKKAATTADALDSQLSSYGISGYKINGSKTNSSGELEITVTQSTASYGDFTSVWTFVKDGGSYLVKDKVVSGMTSN